MTVRRWANHFSGFNESHNGLKDKHMNNGKRYLMIMWTPLPVHGPLRCCFQYDSLHWHRNECDGVSNHQPYDCLLNCLFRRSSKKTPKLRVTGLCAGNTPVTGKFPAQKVSNAENVSIWWRHRVIAPILTKKVQRTDESGWDICNPLFNFRNRLWCGPYKVGLWFEWK